MRNGKTTLGFSPIQYWILIASIGLLILIFLISFLSKSKCERLYDLYRVIPPECQSEIHQKLNDNADKMLKQLR